MGVTVNPLPNADGEQANVTLLQGPQPHGVQPYLLAWGEDPNIGELACFAVALGKGFTVTPIDALSVQPFPSVTSNNISVCVNLIILSC